MFSYSTGYYVSPPDDQFLKFKNCCSLTHTCRLLTFYRCPDRKANYQGSCSFGRFFYEVKVNSEVDNRVQRVLNDL
jgi:hypothetical protein